MTLPPTTRLRLEKAAADCGFEMTPEPLPDGQGLRLRSARFPESLEVRAVGAETFLITPSDPTLAEGVAVEAPRHDRTLHAQGFGALYALLRPLAAFARTRPNRVAQAFELATASLPRHTEAERLVVQRVGQDLFRNALLDFWQARCCVTGLDVPQLLRASHIRPWAHCETDEQRLDVFNGLLLAPHLDALFDAGLMTVEDDGTVHLSSLLSKQQRVQLGLPQVLRIQGLRSGHAAYLAYHRVHVWRG